MGGMAGMEYTEFVCTTPFEVRMEVELSIKARVDRARVEQEASCG